MKNWILKRKIRKAREAYYNALEEKAKYQKLSMMLTEICAEKHQELLSYKHTLASRTETHTAQRRLLPSFTKN